MTLMRYYILLLTLCGLSCKATKETGGATHDTAMSHSMPASQASSPNSCKAEAVVVNILPAGDEDKNSICAKYPCRAKARILEVSGCGSSAVGMPATGDTIEVRFMNTVLNTEQILPAIKPAYPGLRRGTTFIANMEWHMKPMNGSEYIVYDYALK